jgi:restriction endonuclease S subunit
MDSDSRALWVAAGGKVPSHWSFIAFSDLLAHPKSIAVGVMYPGVDTAGGIPLVRVSDIKDGEVQNEPSYRISSEVDFEYRRTRFDGNELLITLVGNPGDCALVSKSMKGWNAARAVAVVKLQDPELRPWLRYVLLSKPAKHLMDARLNTTVQKTLNLKDIRELRLPFPPDSERAAITTALSSIDGKIVANRRINQTLEAMAQAIFKSWFVDFDPVKAKLAAKAEGRDPLRAAMSAISGKTDAELDTLPPDQHAQLAATAALFPDEMEESELGEIPQGWMNSTLGELCKLYGGLIQTGPFGSQLHAHDYTTEGIPVVMPQDLSGRRINIDKIARIGECDAERLHRHRIQAGDIVFSRRGDVGRHALVTPREIGWLCGTGCLLVRPSTRERVSAYVSCALARSESLEWLMRHAVGATMPNLNTTILSSLPIVMVPSAMLTSFQDRVGAMEAAVNVSIAEIETLSELRDTLLPKLLSGELSVTAHEIEALA